MLGLLLVKKNREWTNRGGKKKNESCGRNVILRGKRNVVRMFKNFCKMIKISFRYFFGINDVDVFVVVRRIVRVIERTLDGPSGHIDRHTSSRIDRFIKNHDEF